MVKKVANLNLTYYKQVNELLANINKYPELLRLGICGKRVIALKCRCGRWAGCKLRCNLRICESCAKKRSLMLQRVFDEKIRFLQKSRKFRAGYTLKLMTLTLAHYGDIPTRVEKIKKCFNELWKRRFRSQLTGAIVALEVSGSEHVHIHALMYAPFVDVFELSRLWYEITKDSYIVDYRVVSSWERGLRYVLKYVVKGTSSPLALLELKGKRLVWTKGIFYNVPVGIKIVACCGTCLDYPLKPTMEELPIVCYNENPLLWLKFINHDGVIKVEWL